MHQSIDVIIGVIGYVQYSHLWAIEFGERALYENPKEIGMYKRHLIRSDQYLRTGNRLLFVQPLTHL
jgi:hypothetical protein